MRPRLCTLAVVPLLLISFLPLSRQVSAQENPLTLEMYLDLESVSNPQISPDGLFWCDEGSEDLCISDPGLYSLPLREFGHWLRLRAKVSGVNPSLKVLIYLALKE